MEKIVMEFTYRFDDVLDVSQLYFCIFWSLLHLSGGSLIAEQESRQVYTLCNLGKLGIGLPSHSFGILLYWAV